MQVCKMALFTAVGGPPRPMHFANWKIGVAVVGGVLGIFLLAILALLFWKRKRPSKPLKVSAVLLKACHLYMSSSSGGAVTVVGVSMVNSSLMGLDFHPMRCHAPTVLQEVVTVTA